MTDSFSAEANVNLDSRAGDSVWSWARGGNASVTSIDGDALTVHSTVAFPPGAPLSALSANRVTFEMKVRTCRKLPSGAFEISGKLVNATRPLREKLIAAVAAKDGAQR
jgi:hypothetical protein